jgi:hypothetical protein
MNKDKAIRSAQWLVIIVLLAVFITQLVTGLMWLRVVGYLLLAVDMWLLGVSQKHRGYWLAAIVFALLALLASFGL